MSKARAAEIWAQLERFLIERCGLPDGRMLDRDRPQLIRSIGQALRGGEPVEEKTQRQSQEKRQSQSKSRRQVKRPAENFPAIDRTPQSWWRTNDKPDPVLTAMLERSCSRRMGYDGDDEVSYGPR